ncbi:putative ubiquinol-cytochrome C reductase complex subunit UcrQ [Polyplosphaeria fusca]|uniref:Cytochrome b-c1 complex subunit 8 n=1 Tax=Polyplosphaeria fusca TaxID=682080 RepID=A0A9P4QYX4_9PLEO|nr:putative ubiquinol-cytochrome C reductase complex subunit UcrQ [Polyplosphaeria fusca]
MGGWGNLGSPPQKGVTVYAMSPNRQRPLAGTLNAAFFNTFRRSRNQVLYVVPPLVIAYASMEWAVNRNAYLNSKQGRAEFGDEM